MVEYYYDRRDITAKEVQFFHESRIKRPNKEFDSNMPMDGMWPKDITIKRIIICLSPTLLSSTTARDTAIDDEIVRLLQDMILEVQVGDQPVLYFPLALALPNGIVSGDLEYTLATAADGSYGFLDIKNISGVAGLEVNIPIPASTPLKFFVKSLTTPALGRATAILVVE